MPFQQLWKDPLGDHQEWIYDELYTSNTWLAAQDSLQKLPKENGCTLECIVAGLMFFSDATHLANFGTAKAWPLYLYFGNFTKYSQSSPQSGACHLIGFLLSLPDSIKDVLSCLSCISKTGMASLLTYCHRELFHSCWDTLLDEDFLEAYQHGIVLKCADGMLQRIFPQIFTYLADYPEKVLIATIKDIGTCPCPHCVMPKASFSFLGLLRDMDSHVTEACVFIASGYTVDGAKVENTLGEGLWVPNLNQFMHKLWKFGLDPFHMLVMDLMHECKLGTWKALFTHLIRLLYTIPQGSWLIAILNSR
ncbi:hypothetical protein BDR06DRAFT_981321 [Suillus hirtellus]|nr:hypothetical protein BDR06DRAFT_981321 [Suillus hirtellus]